MTPSEAIESALQRGAELGIDALDATERRVWLISEAEVLCDTEGIDSFIDRYAPWLPDAAHAFSAAGASEIAESLAAIYSSLPELPEPLLSRANTLITSRSGYDFDAVCQLVTPTA